MRSAALLNLAAVWLAVGGWCWFWLVGLDTQGGRGCCLHTMPCSATSPQRCAGKTPSASPFPCPHPQTPACIPPALPPPPYTNTHTPRPGCQQPTHLCMSVHWCVLTSASMMALLRSSLTAVEGSGLMMGWPLEAGGKRRRKQGRGQHCACAAGHVHQLLGVRMAMCAVWGGSEPGRAPPPPALPPSSPPLRPCSLGGHGDEEVGACVLVPHGAVGRAQHKGHGAHAVVWGGGRGRTARRGLGWG